MLLISLFLIVEFWPVLGHISPVRFFTDTSWHPLEGAYHMMPMLAGTLYASVYASALVLVAILLCINIFAMQLLQG